MALGPDFLEGRSAPLIFLASQDALEVMRVTHWVSVSVDFTDVTLVSEDTYWRPDPDDPDESYLVMKVI